MVAHLWSSNRPQKSVQSWSPGLSRNIGDFFRFFQNFQVGDLLLLESFQIFNTVFISTVQNLGSVVELVHSSSIRSQRIVSPQISALITAQIYQWGPRHNPAAIFWVVWGDFLTALLFCAHCWSDLGYALIVLVSSLFTGFSSICCCTECLDNHH